MHILMFSWEYPPFLVGGMGTHVLELVNALAELKTQVTLLTPRWNDGAEIERIHENATIHRVVPPVAFPSNLFPDAQQTNLTLTDYAHQLLQDGARFDLIHAHDWSTSFAAQAIKKIFKLPLVATMHATERGRGRGHLVNEMSKAINGAEWWLTYEAWRVIATSRFMAEEVRAYFELPADKIVIIPNGVDAARFEDNAATDWRGLRDNWALPHEQIVFFIGRVQYEKGIHVLMDAAQHVLARAPHTKFIVAGTGALLPELRQYAEHLGVSDKVLLPGFISDEARDQLFRLADVSVFPSLYEPFGIVALEAMAARCPVIVSDVGGLGEVVDDGYTGIKVPPNNADALAQAILAALRDRAFAAKCAAQAYQVVSQEFSWARVARMTRELYQEIIETRVQLDWE